ncbi:MAG: aminopeptidase [Wenzhouxiangella sp.]|nr:aminopeptidase [Wenzhouxiangella sp.]MCH8479530.1 aminopeptidase [Wenzhouxiangella sp.]
MLKLAFLLLMSAGLSACATLSWYGQAISGHLDLLARRELIADLIERPDTDPELARRLALVLEIRRYAAEELGLPESRSYRHYADLERDAAVWNVVAVAPDSFQARRWCYPISGCVNMRAFFDRERAQAKARGLAEQGLDVAVFPAVAYSTLGWFSDPVLNTMLAWDDARLAAFLFHELAHEKLFVPGDLAFNEAYAVTVERFGVRRWLQHYGQPGLLADWERGRADAAVLVELLLAARADLSELYRQAPDAGQLQAAKQARFAQLQSDLAGAAAERDSRLLASWSERRLNNAHLVMTATYEAGVAAFEALLAACGQAIDCFHQRAAELAAVDAELRREFLQASD